jgi:predicted nucleotidyltransferase
VYRAEGASGPGKWTGEVGFPGCGRQGRPPSPASRGFQVGLRLVAATEEIRHPRSWYNERMAAKRRTPAPTPPPRWYRGADIPMRLIRRFAREVAERFHPDKIILFGSYAYGTPHADSDVDILVVMPARNQHDQAVRIRWAVPAPFPMDLLVRTPHSMRWRLKEGDSFLREIVSKGKILYEKTDAGVGEKGRSRPRHGKTSQRQPDAPA